MSDGSPQGVQARGKALVRRLGVPQKLDFWLNRMLAMLWCYGMLWDMLCNGND